MRETKRRWELFSFYDHTGIERHLEKMAREGWRLVSAEKSRWTYRRAEPKALRYAVVYYPDASQFDPGPTEGQQTLRDYCLAAGWEPVADWGQMQIYATDREDPVPIDTDPDIQLETIHRTMKRSFLPANLVLLVLFLTQLGMRLSDLYWDMADCLSSGSDLSLFFMLFSVIGMECVEIGGYFLWRRRSKRSIAQGGGCVPALGHRRLTWAFLAAEALSLVWMMACLGNAASGLFVALNIAGLFLLAWLSWRLQSAMKRRRFSREVNRAVTLGATAALTLLLMGAAVWGLFRSLSSGAMDRPPAETYEYYGQTWDVYHDPLPLTIQDLTAVDYDRWSTELRAKSTLLAARQVASQQSRFGDGKNLPELDYEIIDVHASFLTGAVMESCLRSVRRYDGRNAPEERRSWYEPVDAAAWRADEAYREYRGGTPRDAYLVRWGDRIAALNLYGGWTLTEAQTAVVAEKLGGT